MNDAAGPAELFRGGMQVNFWEVSALHARVLSASQASYRLPHALRFVDQFRALSRPADRACFD